MNFTALVKWRILSFQMKTGFFEIFLKALTWWKQKITWMHPVRIIWKKFKMSSSESVFCILKSWNVPEISHSWWLSCLRSHLRLFNRSCWLRSKLYWFTRDTSHVHVNCRWSLGFEIQDEKTSLSWFQAVW